MKNNRINLRLLCALSSIFLISNGLQAMMTLEKALQRFEQEKNYNYSNITKNNIKDLLEKNECIGCRFRGVDFSDANFEKANLQGINFGYIESVLMKTNFKEANLRKAIFIGANLLNANFEGANLLNANFKGANLKEARFKGANLKNTRFKGATGMTDQEVINSCAILINTTLPSGRIYSN